MEPPSHRSECDALLSEKGMDGDFMIRDSETNVSGGISVYVLTY